ncbi:bifunctional phosphoglucose/phosphomannose isomerase [Thermoplasmatales archaeon ex4484_30]|nr:MAG: bifunctional phosphoglucose/phosphomannose isomerase [Thermoplasmatales archaeon ex4484_30]
MRLFSNSFLKKFDKNGMLLSAEKFPEQVKEALEIVEKINFSFECVEHVIVAGMGGSAISGEILSHFSKLPFIVVRDYFLPSFANEKTLFIAISYSGNTAETLSCYKEAKKRKCKILSISSGGKLGKERNCILIPSGMQPRVAIAYLLFPLAVILERNDIIEEQNYDEVVETVIKLRERLCSSKNDGNIAKHIAYEIEGYPLIYGYGIGASIAKRWRQQLNENAKMPAFNFALPECNHNEIEAWEGGVNNFTCIFLRGIENDDIKKRFDFMKKIYGEKVKVIEAYAEGRSHFAKAISLLYLGDFVSIYKAILNKVNPTPVGLIMKLKEELSQHSRSSS